MSLFNQLLSRVSVPPEYSDPNELRAIFNDYTDQWPDNNDRYKSWKPISILPAPKWVLKHAMKLGYAEWPGPINGTVFSAFFTEFVDLAMHLPQEKYDAIERFRRQRIRWCGKEDENDKWLGFFAISPMLHCADTYSVEQCRQEIIQIRDGLRRSPVFDPVDMDDRELDAIRRILIEITTDVATLIQEWRFYILSIGRDQYIPEK